MSVEDKVSGAFIGFVGLLYHDDWPEGEHKTDAGWRLDQLLLGPGRATEDALASLRYGFEELSQSALSASHARRIWPPGG